jgi:lipopolysaccharide export system permease protein
MTVTILDRYIAKEFCRFFLLVIASFLSLYLIVDFFEKIRMFLSNHATLGQMASFFLFSIPMITSLIIPAAVLLATLVTYGSLSRTQEIVAMKANGISLYRTSLVTVAISVVICVIAFIISEFISPYTNQKADHIKYIEIQNKQTYATFKQHQIWYRGRQGIYNFKMFDSTTDTLKGVTINYLDKKMNLVMRIDAEKAQWQGGRWVFYNLLITTFQGGGFPTLERVSQKIIIIPETPDDFKIAQKDTDQMGYLELRRYVRKIQAEGYDATRYLVDLQGKIAFPFVSLIMTLIGISFSLRSERSGSIMRSVGTGIAIGFSYWLVHAFSMSLGRSGTISPLIAAWLANVLFGITAAMMYLRVRT